MSPPSVGSCDGAQFGVRRAHRVLVAEMQPDAADFGLVDRFRRYELGDDGITEDARQGRRFVGRVGESPTAPCWRSAA